MLLDEREFTRAVQARIGSHLLEAMRIAADIHEGTLLSRAMTVAEWCDAARRCLDDQGGTMRAEERARAVELIRAVQGACLATMDAQLADLIRKAIALGEHRGRA